MGLFDDAIAEFHIAMGNAARETECVHLIGLCGIDSGRPEMAVDQLERLLQKPKLVKDQALVVRFDLGRALAALGRHDAARAAFQAVMAQDAEVPGRRAAPGGARRARRGGAESRGRASSGFESFDDMLSEMRTTSRTRRSRSSAGESFDDLMSDAEGESRPSGARRPEEEPEPEPEPAPAAEARAPRAGTARA